VGVKAGSEELGTETMPTEVPTNKQGVRDCPHEPHDRIQDDREGMIICQKCSLVLEENITSQRDYVTDRYPYLDHSEFNDEVAPRSAFEQAERLPPEAQKWRDLGNKSASLLLDWVANGHIPRCIGRLAQHYYRATLH
jgi:hypothetical protein